MTIGDALFARLSVRDFTRLSDRVAELQSRIASGLNDPRPSADPARAAELSALRDRVAQLDRAEAAADAAAGRLALTDEVLKDMSDAVRAWHQAALRLGDPALTEGAAEALRAEVLSLRARLLAAANATDAQGQPLFAGTAAGPAFAEVEGAILYRGNDLARQLRPVAGPALPAGVTGAELAGPDGAGLFSGLDDLALALRDPMRSARTEVSAEGTARLDLERSRAGGVVGIALTGPAGTARVQIDLRADAPGAAVEAINAVSGATGVTAALLPDGRGILLSAPGRITLGAQEGDAATRPFERPVIALAPSDAAGVPTGPFLALRPAALGLDSLVAAAGAAVERLAEVRARAGVMAAEVERAQTAIADQRLRLDQAVTGLETLDVAAAVVELQSLLRTQSAAQQTYVRIAGQSLFDYLR